MMGETCVTTGTKWDYPVHDGNINLSTLNFSWQGVCNQCNPTLVTPPAMGPWEWYQFSFVNLQAFSVKFFSVSFKTNNQGLLPTPLKKTLRKSDQQIRISRMMERTGPRFDGLNTSTIFSTTLAALDCRSVEFGRLGHSQFVWAMTIPNRSLDPPMEGWMNLYSGGV